MNRRPLLDFAERNSSDNPPRHVKLKIALVVTLAMSLCVLAVMAKLAAHVDHSNPNTEKAYTSGAVLGGLGFLFSLAGLLYLYCKGPATGSPTLSSFGSLTREMQPPTAHPGGRSPSPVQDPL